MRKFVVTGASSGIGEATCRMLRAAGDMVISVDLHDSDVVADLATETERRQMIIAVARIAGDRIDGVAACAGLSKREAVTISVNYFGTLATLEGLRPLLAGSAAPRALAVTSFAATMTFDKAVAAACLAGDEPAALVAYNGEGDLAYTSSKQALAVRCRQLAVTKDWGGAGILLNMVAPGMVDTPMIAALINDPAAFRKRAETIPMVLGRPAGPDEVARLIGFLLSPENSYMIGQQIFVDGGAEACLFGGMGAMNAVDRERLMIAG